MEAHNIIDNTTITTFAPVLIPTLNRYAHLKRCVESLSRCTHADKTELIIGLDYPPSEKYFEGWESICEYVSKINGFKKVTILKREENFGAVKNLDNLREYASTKYDCFIMTEDDNEFSPNFLDYINKGLEKYKDNPNIFAICGYNYPVDMSTYSYDYYFSHNFAAWGYGSWFNKLEKVFKLIKKDNYIINFYKKYPFKYYFKNHLRLMELSARIGDGFLGDMYITSYLHGSNVFTVFPKISLVRNWGHDGTGINCGKVKTGIEDLYSKQEIDDRDIFPFKDDLPFNIDSIVHKKINDFKKPSWKVMIYLLVCFCIVRTYSKIKI